MAVEDVLEEIRTRLEEKIKRQLSGMQGFVLAPIYNSIMPLHVEISLQPEVSEFVFLEGGAIELTRGRSANPDVRIESDTQTFMSLFQNPSTELFKDLESRNKIRINSLTNKGKNAEGYIRRYLSG